jgi:class 3 adenylate cyclase
MADISKMNRTWLCSVVFLDIVEYSSQSVDLQMKWKERFNGYLSNAIKDVPEDERVILDTGDGAAACFLGAPEVAMFAALELWHSLLLDERKQQPPFRVRIGINLGPVKLVRDINGAPNAIGDGMNAGQRIMSFAGENQILVSQSYFEVVSRLSDDYKNLFTLKGVERDKHIREHTVYDLSPPGGEHSQGPVTPQQAVSDPAATSQQPSASPEKVAQTAPKSQAEKKARAGSRWIPLLVGGIALAVVAAVGGWHFFGSAVRSNPSVNTPPAKPGQIGATSPVVAPSAAVPPPAPVVSAAKEAPTPSPEPVATAAKKAPTPPPAPVVSAAKEAPTPSPEPIATAAKKAPTPSPEPVSTAAKKAPDPLPARISPPATRASPTSGVLHATIASMQHGDVVFNNLPGGRLKFTFDRDAWQATIRRQPNGTRTLVMHSLKPGSQTACDVGWNVVQ